MRVYKFMIWMEFLKRNSMGAECVLVRCCHTVLGLMRFLKT